MDIKQAGDLAVLVGALEDAITKLPEWEELSTVDPSLWEHCDAGYESVAVFIIKMHQRIGEVY